MRATLLYVAAVFGAVVAAGDFFDAAGRLTQVEYADKASMRGGTILGVCSDTAAVLLTWSPVPPTSLPSRKIHRIARTFGVSSSGIASDVHFATNKVFEEALEHVHLFGSEAPAIRVAKSLATYLHKQTLVARLRPLGIRMCVASYDRTSRGAIYEIDPMGNLHRCTCACVGPMAEQLMAKWRAKQADDDDDGKTSRGGRGAAELLADGLDVLKSCLAEADEPSPLSAGDVSVAFVGEDLPFSVLEHGSEEMEAAIEQGDLAPLRRRCQPPSSSAVEGATAET
jgi:20S proteasome alpha/beta subunit